MREKPTFTGAYAPMNAYIAPLRGELWRVIVGIAVMVVVYFLGIVMYFGTIAALAAVAALNPMNPQDFDLLLGGTTPPSMLVFLGSFVFMTLAVLVAAIWPARRPLASLLGPLPLAWRNFLRVLLGLIPLMALVFLLTLFLDPTVVARTDFAALLPWLPYAMVALLIQTSSEELAFRGFIMGQLAARSARRWVWMIVPSILFGAVHYDGATYGMYALVICGATLLFALAASDLTARTGNLGAAIAVHFANNVMAMILVSQAGKMDGLALYTAKFDPSDLAQILLQLLLTLILWLAARFALKV